MLCNSGVTKHHTGPKYRYFVYKKKIESTCCSMNTGILEGNWIDKYWNNFEFKYNWKADPIGPEAVVEVFLVNFL